MKKLIFLVILLLVLQLWSLDPVYHTNEEIFAELDSLAQLHPDIMMVREMGLSGTDQLPVYAVKISDNVMVDEDEPALLFLGQCHAEEVIGVEISLDMINEILTNRYNTPFSVWINNLEIWIVPTHNPEGLQVVTDEWDETYRKNKRDNNENGIFDFVVGMGNDIDGVDLNRNYDFNWVHSDTLYCPYGEEQYDYYRGAYPWSEPELQYIRELTQEQHFIYSIAWHSSRTGFLSEQVIYPWNWADNKPCPDLDFNTEMANYVAHLIENEEGNGYYEPSGTLGRNSKAHDWFYNEYGTLQFEIEAGRSNIQPNPALLQDTIDRCKNAPYYMMNRALGYNAVASMLTGHVTDAVTGEPMVAEYIIEERHASSFTPRMTDELYGRFWWQCLHGSYTLHIRQKGYEDYISSVGVNQNLWAIHDVELQPLEQATLNGQIAVTATDVTITVRHPMGDEEFVITAGSGDYSLDWWEGTTEIIISAEGYCPQFISYDLSGGNNNLDIELSEEVVVFSEDWSGDFSEWLVDGDWFIGYDEEAERNFAKDTSDDFYADESEAVLTTAGFYNLHNGTNLSLAIEQKYHTEHDEDFCIVEISTNFGGTWHELQSVSGISDWKCSYYDLDDYQDTLVWLRLRLVTDDSVTDPGWWLGEIKLVSATMVDNQENELPVVTRLQQNYPNPFYMNGSRADCRIDFSLAEAGEVSINVYNVKGQMIKTLTNEYFEHGNHSLYWNGQGTDGDLVASGMYFYLLKTNSETLHQKMLIIK